MSLRDRVVGAQRAAGARLHRAGVIAQNGMISECNRIHWKFEGRQDIF